MERVSKAKQSGVSFLGVLIIVGFLACAGVIAAQVFPTFVEYQAILKAAQKASAGNSVPEVRQLFDKAAEVDDFKSVKGKDLEISKEGDKVIVAFAYNKEIHLAGPAYLLLKYADQSK